MRISGTTTLLGPIGTPVEHSKSPAMYNHCFQKSGLDWAYLAFDIPQEKAGDAVQAIRTLGMRGANVTMPCKNAVIPYLDKLTPAAEAIQAVNTIVNENGTLVGHNTDGCGYTQNLRRSGVEVKGKRIVLLGGGGDRRLQPEGRLLAPGGEGSAGHRPGCSHLRHHPERPPGPGSAPSGHPPLRHPLQRHPGGHGPL